MKRLFVIFMLTFLCGQTYLFAVDNPANPPDVFASKSAITDSVAAWIARSDSSLFPDGKLSITEIQQLSTRLSEKLIRPSIWGIPLPIIPDTTASSLDSLTVLQLSDLANNPYEYTNYLHAFGNGSSAVDSLFMTIQFENKKANPDSIIYWLKASTTDADSASLIITVQQKDRTDTDTPYTSGNIGVSTKDTWERKAAEFDDFRDGSYTLVVRFRLRMSQTVEVGQIWFK